MAGFGERFKKIGFSLPKSLIKIKNRPLISYIDSQFGIPKNKIFICNSEHLNNKTFQMKLLINEFVPEALIASINPHKLGPVYSLICAENYIHDDIPVIISYCDCLSIFDIQSFMNEISENDIDGIVFTYEGFHPNKIRSMQHAYIKEKNGYIINVKEKKPFTNDPYSEKASSGVYYFRSGKMLKELCRNAYKNNTSTNGEFFVSMLFKELIRNRKKIKSFNIDQFVNWGTPEDFLDYLESIKLYVLEESYVEFEQTEYLDNFSNFKDVETLKKRLESFKYYNQSNLNRETSQKISDYWKTCSKKIHALKKNS